MNMDPSSDATKIPVWRTVANSIVAPLHHRSAFMQITVRFLLPLCLAAMLANFLFKPWTTLSDAKTAANMTGWPLFAYRFGTWIDIFAQMIICSFGAVLWHRVMLLDGVSGNEVPAGFLKKSAHYFAVVLVLSLWWIVPAILFSVFVSIPETDPDAVGDGDAIGDGWACVFCLTLLSVIAVLLAWPVFLLSRLALILPSIAINARRLTFKDAWSLTRGNTLRIGLISTLPAVPVFMACVGISLIAPTEGWKSILHAGAAGGIYGLLTLVSVSALSLIYRHFVRHA